MPGDYSLADIGPTEWRRLLSPLGALWLAALGTGLVASGVLTAADVPPAGLPLGAAVAGTLLAWLGIGLVALCSAWPVERLWLARWPHLGAALTRRRRSRWWREQKAVEEAVAAGDGSRAQRHAQRRSAIAVAEPLCPHWIADRWAALAVRVGNAYGLDVVATWPRLWLTLPEPVRDEVRLAAAQWHRACVWASWAVLFAPLALVWWPLAAVAALVAGLAWARGRWSLANRADLIEATFDTSAPGLAQAMGIPVDPSGPLSPAAGRQITARILKGA